MTRAFIFLPRHWGQGVLRSEAKQTGGGSPHAGRARHFPLRFPRLKAGFGTSPMLGEERCAGAAHG